MAGFLEAAKRVAVLVGREPPERHSVHRAYADAVWSVGAVPLILTPPPATAGAEARARHVEAVLDCDALCVTGGGDVDPQRYGQKPLEQVSDVDPERDQIEVEAVQAAVGRRLPLLGICRGIQLMAVALGGSLNQDLPALGINGHWDEREYDPVHAVEAKPASLAFLVLAGATRVNSTHHQAVRDPGPLLAATAWSEDGVIEAVEAIDGGPLLGVQWHPERLATRDPRHLAPFRWLVESGGGA
jgi:putative glutamine amidotransferase